MLKMNFETSQWIRIYGLVGPNYDDTKEACRHGNCQTNWNPNSLGVNSWKRTQTRPSYLANMTRIFVKTESPPQTAKKNVAPFWRYRTSKSCVWKLLFLSNLWFHRATWIWKHSLSLGFLYYSGKIIDCFDT